MSRATRATAIRSYSSASCRSVSPTVALAAFMRSRVRHMLTVPAHRQRCWTSLGSIPLVDQLWCSARHERTSSALHKPLSMLHAVREASHLHLMPAPRCRAWQASCRTRLWPSWWRWVWAAIVLHCQAATAASWRVSAHPGGVAGSTVTCLDASRRRLPNRFAANPVHHHNLGHGREPAGALGRRQGHQHLGRFGVRLRLAKSVLALRV